MLRRLRQKERQLAERLRREADDERPAFSASLHARVMRAVVSADMSAQGTQRRRFDQGAWALAAAAVVLLATGGAFFLAAQPTAVSQNAPTVADRNLAPPAGAENTGATAGILPQPSPLPESTSRQQHAGPQVDGLQAISELYDVAIDQVENIQAREPIVEADLIGSQLAMLNHDARIVAGWLIDPLTVTLEGN